MHGTEYFTRRLAMSGSPVTVLNKLGFGMLGYGVQCLLHTNYSVYLGSVFEFLCMIFY